MWDRFNASKWSDLIFALTYFCLAVYWTVQYITNGDEEENAIEPESTEETLG